MLRSFCFFLFFLAVKSHGFFVPEFLKPKEILFSIKECPNSDLNCQSTVNEVLNLILEVAKVVPTKTVFKNITDTPSLKEIDNNTYLISKDSVNNVWARDWGPIFDNSDGKLRAHLNNYKSKFSPEFNSARFDILKSIGNTSDVVFNDFTFDGGNLMVGLNGQCFTGADHYFFDTLASYYKSIENYLLSTGCNSVYFLKNPVGERTRHIDVYFKILSDKKVILADYSNEKSKLLMEENYQLLTKLGYEVQRIENPFIATTHYSYVNSLIIEQTAFLPIYDLPQDQNAIRFYEDLGFKVVPIVAKNIITLQGSFRCLSAPIY